MNTNNDDIAQMASIYRVPTDRPLGTDYLREAGYTQTADDIDLMDAANKQASFQLQDKVVLLLLTLRAPGNERTVRDKSIVKTDANLGRLHVGKRLLECKEQQAIQILDGQMRDWVARLALPSPFKAGTHVIALGLLDTIDKGLLEFQTQRCDAIDRLAEVYEEAKTEARQQLGTLYREEEYLSPDALREAYSMRWQYVTLAPPDQMKMLNAEIFERERGRLQEQWDSAVGDMRDALRVGLAELVNDMVARLADPDKKFKPTKLLARFDEFLSTFEARNVTSDDELNALAQTARSILTGVDTEALTKSKEIREQVREGFAAAQASLATLETASKRQRRISFEDE